MSSVQLLLLYIFYRAVKFALMLHFLRRIKVKKAFEGAENRNLEEGEKAYLQSHMHGAATLYQPTIYLHDY